MDEKYTSLCGHIGVNLSSVDLLAVGTRALKKSPTLKKMFLIYGKLRISHPYNGNNGSPMPSCIHSHHILVRVVYGTRYLLRGECGLKSSSTLTKACSQAQDFLCLDKQADFSNYHRGTLQACS